MATKHYSHETFTFTVNGETMSFYCSTTNTRSGFCHHAFFWGLGISGEHTRVSYYNRTWESFNYESVLLRAIDKLPKAYREGLRMEIDKKAGRIHEQCEKQAKAFEALWGGLSEDNKNKIRETVGPDGIQTEGQAAAVHGMAALLSLGAM